MPDEQLDADGGKHGALLRRYHHPAPDPGYPISAWAGVVRAVPSFGGSGRRGRAFERPIGPVAKSTALYLRYRMEMPYRVTAELSQELLRLKFVPASGLLFDRKAEGKGTASFPVCPKPPEDKASIQGTFCKPSSVQIQKGLKLHCITTQADVSMARG